MGRPRLVPPRRSLPGFRPRRAPRTGSPEPPPGTSSVQDGGSAHLERLPDPGSPEPWSRFRSAGCLPWPLSGGTSGLIHGVSPVEPSPEGSPTGLPTGCTPVGSSSEEPSRVAAHEAYSVGLPGAPPRTSFRGPPPGVCPGRAPFQRLLGASTLGTFFRSPRELPSPEGPSRGHLS
jgi:hypothetical protein